MTTRNCVCVCVCIYIYRPSICVCVCVCARVCAREKPKNKRPLGRPRRRWEDNIKMALQEVGLGVWTGSIWIRIETGGGHL